MRKNRRKAEGTVRRRWRKENRINPETNPGGRSLDRTLPYKVEKWKKRGEGHKKEGNDQ